MLSDEESDNNTGNIAYLLYKAVKQTPVRVRDKMSRRSDACFLDAILQVAKKKY